MINNTYLAEVIIKNTSVPLRKSHEKAVYFTTAD
jgi:hypothetical protein